MKIIFKYTILLVGAAVFAYPFLWMFASSLKPEIEIGGFSLISAHFNFNNYAEVFQRIPIARALINSIFVSMSTTASAVIFGSLVGYALSRMNFRGRNGLYALILFTMMIPFQVTLIPQYVLMVKLGLTDTYLALIAPTMISALGIIMFRQFFLNFPQALIDAARIDGCTNIGIIFKVIWPVSKPIVVTVALLSFMASWNDVLWPIIVIRDRSLMTLPQIVTLFTIGGEAEALLGLQLAAATLLALPIILIYIFFQRYFIESMVSSGIKG